ncbi:MAG: adenylate/guanylate cyclase domain-containing protein [Alphaproteobacteria bacterium]|nr:adenylate/guanylate cyclase domain-containing protein [Alphaproteobacteria bacterium]MBU0798882.1 adenylate/guanylate cyclase domain-containing protein [Alphaproteobacteria bacterium]MBU0888732.1 adenylate/guanylate cyclase domain-containing protein [Alphaproteobacteria bacterium]MBU1813534.1 adenylate/guanylate cyclase domain-containing protein [Alphaproteobacteria bacterium]MBU2091753.1 adenylate/guanylate cyclase domain-containing protein [Alphaproteobacteria bacterium]
MSLPQRLATIFRASSGASNGAGDAALPLRLRSAIEAQQAGSEILIGWIQLGIVATFAVLYSLAPKTFHPDVLLQPVPWALALYAGFTLFRLVLAYRRRLPVWFLYLSIVADMALLLVTIWSFHLQYQQPASFYLKAPTVLYIFIFIALRALRFEARFVLAAGLAAALGWLALVGYAVFSVENNPMITRNYVTYLTSNSVLLGAEFDKVISIALVTTIIALAILRARKLLVRAVVGAAAAQDLSRFFAPEIAARITGAEHDIRAGEGEIRRAAILTIDIRGFTRLSMEVPPREVMALLSEYQSRLVPVIQNHGGCIDKFLGDGIMATFGAALPTQTYAADALRAVEAIIAVVADWNAERQRTGLPAIRIGAAVAVGPVLFGAVGDATRLEYTVIGEAVNLAAKLEKQTKAEGVTALTTAETTAQAEQQGYRPATGHRPLPHRPVEGVTGALDLVVLAE